MIRLMARAIAIETSGRVGSIATVINGQVLEEREFAHGLQHASQIVAIMDDLCRRQGWKPADVQELYVSAGPGSFTGLRIGITLAKTFAMATGARIVATPTTRVLAENAPDQARHVVIVLDAKREQIFTARFERVRSDDGEAKWVQREPAHLDDLPATLARSPRPVHLLGEGLPYHSKFLPTDDPQVIVTPPQFWRARASAVARIGVEMARAGQYADPLTLTPIYIRRPEAEEKAEKMTNDQIPMTNGGI